MDTFQRECSLKLMNRPCKGKDLLSKKLRMSRHRGGKGVKNRICKGQKSEMLKIEQTEGVQTEIMKSITGEIIVQRAMIQMIGMHS